MEILLHRQDDLLPFVACGLIDGANALLSADVELDDGMGEDQHPSQRQNRHAETGMAQQFGGHVGIGVKIIPVRAEIIHIRGKDHIDLSFFILFRQFSSSAFLFFRIDVVYYNALS